MSGGIVKKGGKTAVLEPTRYAVDLEQAERVCKG